MMIDLHCHILPGIDDGAQNVQEAKAMLALAKDAGVQALCLTPHFDPEVESVETFLAERQSAWDALKAELDPALSGQLRLGAEVRCCQQLLTLDLKRLALGNSSYLLLELPAHRYPAGLSQLVQTLLNKGLIPMFSHVERCAYFRKEPELLKQLVELGALAQVTAASLFDRKDKNFAVACLQHGLAQIVVSDAHDMTGRKPRMELLEKLPEELKRLHEVFSTAVWEDEVPVYVRPTAVRKLFFRYR